MMYNQSIPFTPEFLSSALQFNPTPGPQISWTQPGATVPPVPPGPNPAPNPTPAPGGAGRNPFLPKDPSPDGSSAMSLEDKLKQAKQTGVSQDFGSWLGSALLGSTIASPMGPFKAGIALGADYLGMGDLLKDSLGIDLNPTRNLNNSPAWNKNFDWAAANRAKLGTPQVQAVTNLAAAMTPSGGVMRPGGWAPGQNPATRSPDPKGGGRGSPRGGGRGSDGWGSRGGTESRDPGREGKFR